MSTNFGRDISCTDSLRTGRFAIGSRIVAEATYRRLSTPRGMLRGGEDEADYGLDLTELIGSASAKADAASLEGRVKSELSKDERLTIVSVIVTPVTVGPATTFSIAVKAETADGPFTLQIGVSEVTVELLGIQES